MLNAPLNVRYRHVVNGGSQAGDRPPSGGWGPRNRLLVLPMALVAWACTGGTGDPGNSSTSSSSGAGGGDAGVEDPRWVWREAPASALGARWGALAADVPDGTTILVSGIGGTVGPGLRDIQRASSVNGATAFEQLGTLPATRYCGCAMFDPTRGEVVVVGGRNGSFQEVPTAALFSLSTGMTTEIPNAVPAEHPVGCMAAFDPMHDKGFVFGGLGQNDPGYFSSKTWRYEPATHTFTELTASGPLGRYDAAFKAPEAGGPIYLVGGLGLVGGRQTLFSDVWTLDPAAESWAEVPSASSRVPTGRRYPWVAFAPDRSLFLYGFGSDSGRGDSFLGDLWKFDLGTREWTQIDAETPPSARGFAWRLPGAPGTAGLMLAGLDANGTPEDAWELVPPSNLRGDGWR